MIPLKPPTSGISAANPPRELSLPSSVYKRKKSAEILLVLLHYTACGFDFLGLSQLKNTDGLPQHYHNAVVSLFELKVQFVSCTSE